MEPPTMYVDYSYNDSSDEAVFAKRLAKLQKFTDADLLLNRAGKLSDPQWFRVLTGGLRFFLPLAGLVAGLVVLTLLVSIVTPKVLFRPWLALKLGPFVVAVTGPLTISRSEGLLQDYSGLSNYSVYVTPRCRYLVALEKAAASAASPPLR